MIAINIPKRRIIFRSGQTDEEKFRRLDSIFFDNKMFIMYWCPIDEFDKNIPDVLEFKYDENVY